MKIVHLNTNSSGGAAVACFRLHRALLAAGAESDVLVLGPVPEGIPRVHSYSEWLEKKYGKAYTQLLLKLNRFWHAFPLLGRTRILFSRPVSLLHPEKHPLVKQADVVNLHWVSKFVHLPGIFADKSKRYVWTCHDVAPFSGGHHIETGFPAEEFAAVERKHLSIKTKAIEGCTLAVVSPSQHNLSQCRNSKVFSNFTTVHIPNCIDTDIFHPLDKDRSKTELGIDPLKKVLLFVAEHKAYLIKRFDLLEEALKHLDMQHRCLLVMGQNFEAPEHAESRMLGFVSKDERLVQAYSAADVFITPSVEDNLPNTVMEALACGTPVVAFATGGIPEMVENGKEGIICDSVDAGLLAEGIARCLEMNSDGHLSENARKKVLENYTPEKVSKAYLELYESLRPTR